LSIDIILDDSIDRQIRFSITQQKQVFKGFKVQHAALGFSQHAKSFAVLICSILSFSLSGSPESEKARD